MAAHIEIETFEELTTLLTALNLFKEGVEVELAVLPDEMQYIAQPVRNSIASLELKAKVAMLALSGEQIDNEPRKVAEFLDFADKVGDDFKEK